jgi:lysophospholipase L1-like esterase
MNRFQPLQHLNNGESEGPSSPKPLRPGPHLYSEMVKNTATTMILTDSMAGGIKMNNIKKNIGVRDRAAVIKRFPGHTADDIAYYASKPLIDSKPDQVIIIAGTNDLTRSIYEKGTVDELKVVDNILNIGRAARKHGAKQIHISSIMARRGHRYSETVKSVNNLLFMACMVEDFLLIDQDDIKLAQLSADGIHLNCHGTAILMFNIFSVFSAFNSSFMDFKQDYDYAMSLC